MCGGKDVSRHAHSALSASFWGSISAKGYESASPMTQRTGTWHLPGTSTLANIATLKGKAVAELTEGDLRGVQGHDVIKRGIISLDANAIAQARKAIRRAASDGHDSVHTRFTRDRTYALRVIEAGYNQRTMRQWDVLIQAMLPNPGRSHLQRRLAQGSLYRAGLVDNTADLPVAIAWFGSFFSLSGFARLAARSKVADQVLTFGADHQPLNLTSPNALLMQLQDYANKDFRSMQDNARQARQMAESKREKAKGKGKSKDKGEEKGKPRSEPYGKGGLWQRRIWP